MIINIKIEGNFKDIDEVILKMSELIKEGYTTESIEQKNASFSINDKTYDLEPAYVITLHNRLANWWMKIGGIIFESNLSKWKFLEQLLI